MRKTFGIIFIGMGLLGGLISLLSAIGILFDLDIAFGTRGAKSALPKDWIACAAIAVLSLLFAALGGVLHSDRVARFFRSHRAARYGLVLALPVLGYAGFIQLRYFNHGGKLQWAAATNQIAVIEEMIAEGDFDDASLSESYSKAVHFENADAIEALRQAGPVLLDEDCQPLRFATTRGAEITGALLRAGADPSQCPDLDLAVDAAASSPRTSNGG